MTNEATSKELAYGQPDTLIAECEETQWVSTAIGSHCLTSNSRCPFVHCAVGASLQRVSWVQPVVLSAACNCIKQPCLLLQLHAVQHLHNQTQKGPTVRRLPAAVEPCIQGPKWAFVSTAPVTCSACGLCCTLLLCEWLVAAALEQLNRMLLLLERSSSGTHAAHAPE